MLTGRPARVDGADLLDGPLDKDAARVVAGAETQIRAVGGRWASDPASWAAAADLKFPSLVGVDLQGMPLALLASCTSLTD